MERFQTQSNNWQAGFSLMELMVVLTIFVLVAGMIIANFAGLRAGRNLKIAQNELVSNFRKVQGYTLSSRALNGTLAVQYYLLKFDLSTPNRYTLQALYDVNSSPKLYTDVETIFLPQGVRFATSSNPVIDRPPIQHPAAPSDSTVDVTPGFGNTSPCVLVAFKLPFNTVIINGGQDLVNFSNTGCRFNSFSSDDYAKIKDFAANSSSNTASNNSVITLTLITDDNSLTKTVTLNGLTGAVTFSP